LKGIAVTEAIQETRGLSVTEEDRIRIAQNAIETNVSWMPSRDVRRTDNPILELQ
jgi:hypothetical protein